MTDIKNIGSYQVVRELGKGLMGTVYHASLDSQYWALRVMPDNAVRQSPTVNKLVGDEKHPALVRYKETGVDPGVGSFVSTDFIDARPISRDGLAGVPVTERIKFLVNLMDGLKWLHGQNLVHGCIKPSNVLMTKRGKTARGLFIDAGLVYVPGPATDARLLRRAYPYMAPELIEAYRSGDRKTIDQGLTPAVDIYAAGLLIAEALSGRKMFTDARSIDHVLMRKARTTLSMTGLNQSLYRVEFSTLTQVVAKAAEPDPGRRCSSIAELMESLAACTRSPESEAAAG